MRHVGFGANFCLFTAAPLLQRHFWSQSKCQCNLKQLDKSHATHARNAIHSISRKITKLAEAYPLTSIFVISDLSSCSAYLAEILDRLDMPTIEEDKVDSRLELVHRVQHNLTPLISNQHTTFDYQSERHHINILLMLSYSAWCFTPYQAHCLSASPSQRTQPRCSTSSMIPIQWWWWWWLTFDIWQGVNADWYRQV